MEEKVAKIISILFQPLLIPTYTLLVLFNLNSYIAYMIPGEARQFLIWIVVLSTFVFPLIFILILYKNRLIKSVNMDAKEERILPLIITGIFYFLAYYIVRQTHLDLIFQLLFLGSAILIILSLIISIRWKISMHMIGVGGFVGALIGINQRIHADVTFYVILGVLVCGLVGFARLKLKAHTQSQVYAGLIVGFLGMLLLFFF